MGIFKYSTFIWKIVWSSFIWAFAIMLSITGVLYTVGKDLLIDESYRRFENEGKHLKIRINRKIDQIESLARALANGAETLPHEDEIFKKNIKNILDDDFDKSIAGGGYGLLLMFIKIKSE